MKRPAEGGEAVRAKLGPQVKEKQELSLCLPVQTGFVRDSDRMEEINATFLYIQINSGILTIC